MLEEKIYKDYLSALKERNKHRINFLSFIRSELKNQAFNLKKDKLEDAEALAVLSKQKKRLDESRESMASSNRADLLGDIDKEIILINEYLPRPLDNNEVIMIVEKIIKEASASSMKDMGRVMKEAMAEIGVRADSKTVSDLVRNKLTLLSNPSGK